jgi:hypothetical protein
MQDLQLIGVHEDGEHLLLSGADNQRFLMPVDDALRAAIRRERPRFGQPPTDAEGELRPRDVQALIRAGASTEEAASRAGWTVEKVHRYEGPILAEREHVAGLAQQARLRAHAGTRAGVSAGGSAPTLSARVVERLQARDVEVTDASWDSWRAEGGPWTVVLTFAAGGRQRQASWTFNLADKTVAAMDDEARWLSEDEEHDTQGPIPSPKLRPSPRQDSTVYDVEAEGGLQSVARDEHLEDPLDLMTAMRKRSTARARRKTGSRGAAIPPVTPKAAPEVPGPLKHEAGRQELPLDDREYGAYEPQPGTEPAALVDVGDEAFAVVDDAPHKPSPHETSSGKAAPGTSDANPEPMEASEPQVPQVKAKARSKRPAREAARKTGRPSVPAWDEIMFGSRSGGDRSSS